MKKLPFAGKVLFALLAMTSLRIGSSNALTSNHTIDYPTAMAIDGPGWFMLRDATSGEFFYTRHGDFFLDVNGQLSTTQGFLVQGIIDTPSGLVGSITIDTYGMPSTSDPEATITSFGFETEGRLILSLSDHTQFVRAQLLLQNFRQPEKLRQILPHLFSAGDDAGPLPEPLPPGSPGQGLLKIGSVDPEDPRWTILPEARRDDPLVTGAFTFTGVPTDLGIRGDGFFLLRDPQTSALFATRAGLFLIDGDGYLISYNGLRVQGRNDAALMTFGDIRIDKQDAPPTADPSAAIVYSHIDRQGRVRVGLSDGTTFVRGQVVLHSFRRPELLVKSHLALFSGVNEASPQEAASGIIQSGALELINVTRDVLALRRQLQFFAQGALRRTGNPTDLAIAGSGFFIVRDPTNGEILATRNGAFHFDEAGYLVTRQGRRVQGYTDSDLSLPGDIRLDTGETPPTSDPAASIVSFAFDTEGKLNVNLSDGTQYVRAQVLLQRFAQSYLLRPAGNGTFSNLAAARPLPAPAPQRTLGIGGIQPGALEIPWKIEKLTLPPRHGIRLLITGEPGDHYVIQGASRFKGWETIGNVRLGRSGETEFFDPRKRPGTPRDYRIQPAPPEKGGE